MQADSGEPDDLDHVMDVIRTGHGRLDVLYASAGIGSVTEPLEAVTAESFDSVFAVNVRGTLLTVQKALPLMGAGGSIIITGSIAAVKGVPGNTVYAASKAALRSFVRTWTAELKGRGIRVNLIQPGPILDTATFGDVPDQFRDMIVAMVPAGRGGTSAEIASAALFLASTESSFTYGSEVFVDGGLAQV